MTVSTAPAHIRSRYLRGGCFALAIELHSRTGLPLYGLVESDADDAAIEHAFVADPAGEIGIDIRGSLPISRMAEGARNPDLLCRPISAGRIMAQVFSFDPADLREARRVIREHLRGLPRKSSALEPRRPTADAAESDHSPS